jgi:hypothetical protein
MNYDTMNGMSSMRQLGNAPARRETLLEPTRCLAKACDTTAQCMARPYYCPRQVRLSECYLHDGFTSLEGGYHLRQSRDRAANARPVAWAQQCTASTPLHLRHLASTLQLHNHPT